MKRLILSTLFFLFIVSNLFAASKFVVVIDPGHGGRDAGAVRGQAKEKIVNLKVAIALGRLIEKNYSDVEVVYTRKSDKFVDLEKRAEIANKAQANLFISIHTNSTASKSTTAFGADTYILGLARGAANLAVAKRENSVILLEDDYKQKYEGFDPHLPESYIIFEFMTNKSLEQSLQFASYVQKNFKTVANRRDRGVHQAGFLVLRETACPSVLIEVGFINNPTEAAYLMSSSGQELLARAIYGGFCSYKKEFDKKKGLTTTSKSSSSRAASTSRAEVDTTVEDTVEEGQVKSSTLSSVTKETKPSNNNIEYRIQFLTSEVKLKKGSPKLKGVWPVDYYLEGKIYKYTYGTTSSYREALKNQREIRQTFKDAFLIQFKDGKRVK